MLAFELVTVDCGGAVYARENGIQVLLFPSTKGGPDGLSASDLVAALRFALMQPYLHFISIYNLHSLKWLYASLLIVLRFIFFFLQYPWASGSFLYIDTIICLLTRNAEIDFVLLAGYLKLIPGQLIQAYPRSILNIHPSLLPAFGGKGYFGMKVHKAVIASGARSVPLLEVLKIRNLIILSSSYFILQFHFVT